MKSLSFLIAALLAVPVHTFAADAVKVDVYLAGQLQNSISLVGPNASVKFSPTDMPGSTLELRLIAPEPVIIEMKETMADGKGRRGDWPHQNADARKFIRCCGDEGCQISQPLCSGKTELTTFTEWLIWRDFASPHGQFPFI
jgi:hypothetical protein